MLDIFERLNKGEHLSKRDLTSYYGVGEKTIQRDIDDIRNYLADEHGYEPDVTVKYNRGQNYYYEAPRNLVRQRKEISASTAKYAQLAETAIADNDNTRETVHCLVEAAANAKGQTNSTASDYGAAERAQCRGSITGDSPACGEGST